MKLCLERGSGGYGGLSGIREEPELRPAESKPALVLSGPNNQIKVLLKDKSAAESCGCCGCAGRAQNDTFSCFGPDPGLNLRPGLRQLLLVMSL